MGQRNTIEAGGLVMLLAGFATAGFMWVQEGLGLMVLGVMVIAVNFVAMGFTTMTKPHLWPVTGVGSIGLAVAVYVGLFGEPLWASVGVLGGAICLVGGLAGQLSGSTESVEPS